MGDIAIRVENLSKKFELGVLGAGSLRELFSGLFAGKKARNEFWALSDLSFDVNQGDIVGIVGKNGAGKSTLLKILSRITQPTTGRIEINGRVSSLLEVGTGFNPELTGKENIYLNGTILGMSRSEISRKYDEIVDFSGVARFLDTPVKHYSSGMYVRLAFAVAAHLEPEILIIDEVLAVGDSEFQQKCLGKMGEVSKSGRTILFVSHNMSAVMSLCNKGILLKQGKLLKQGNISDIVTQYMHSSRNDSADKNLEHAPNRNGNGYFRFTRWALTDTSGHAIENAMCGRDVQFHLYFNVNNPAARPVVHFSIRVVDNFDRNIFHISTTQTAGGDFKISEDLKKGKVVITLPRLPLPAGVYNIHLFVSDLNVVFDEINFAGEFKVEEGNYFGNGKTLDPKLGIVCQSSEWQLINENV